jgi:hypothetical protein
MSIIGVEFLYTFFVACFMSRSSLSDFRFACNRSAIPDRRSSVPRPKTNNSMIKSVLDMLVAPLTEQQGSTT